MKKKCNPSNLCKKCDSQTISTSNHTKKIWRNSDMDDSPVENKKYGINWVDENQTRKIADEIWKDFLTDGGFVHHQMII